MPDLKGFHKSNTAQENEEGGNIKMPVRKVKGGFKWGKSGKVYKTKKEAEAQGRAIYASGYKKNGKKKKKKKR